MTDLNGSDPRTLIISNNMIEADDLIEMLTGQDLGPVAHTRDVHGALAVLKESASQLRLLLYGLSLHLHEINDFLATIDRSAFKLIVIDGPADFAGQEGAAVLHRPYSTGDVLAALAQVGLSP